jgi:glutamate carboxypeptidase
MNVAGKSTAREILLYMKQQKPVMIELLRNLTEAESPSDEPQSQHRVQELIAAYLEGLAYRVRRIPGRVSGGMIFACPKSRKHGQHSQLILGHFDTVWPSGTLGNMPFTVDGDTVHGPGVYDMKGGIVQALLALDALHYFGIDAQVSPVVFLNSDEEIGSRESGRRIRKLAPLMDRVLVLEPSLGASGRLKTTRKGIARFTITVSGEAAHAGLDPGRGASAILELSHVIQALFALNDLERGITVNVGTIDGGLRPNVIAPLSTAVVDVRVATALDGEAVERAIRNLQPATPGTGLEIKGGFGRPAMEQTPANLQLWQLARQLGGKLNLELEQCAAGGGSDGNTTSQYTATLDGLGAVGDGAHAAHEHLKIAATLERAALLVLLLMAAPLGCAEQEGVADVA